jgi:hypothetical protein
VTAILLTADLCPALIALIEGGDAPVDGVEVGPWYLPEAIRRYRRQLPDLPFTFHGDDLFTRIGFDRKAIPRMRESVEAAGSPWFSAHVASLLPGTYYRYLKGIPPLPHSQRRTLRRFLRQAARTQAVLDVPVLLENLAFDPPLFHRRGLDFDADPARLSHILEQTGCPMLLDLSHAQIAAARRGMAAQDYLLALPLERVMQVHVSGPRMRDGCLMDAHEPLREEDYGLLRWTLDRCQPQMVTLEYIREQDALREQLARLRSIVDGR